MQHVRSTLGFDEADTVAAGDSVNDLLMLQQVGATAAAAARASQQLAGQGRACASACAICCCSFHTSPQAHTSIVVANSTPEVKAWAASAQQAAAAGAQPQRVFVAQQPVAAGVLEGLQALGWVCGS